MSEWAKQSAERIRAANDRSRGRQDWWMFQRQETIARGERLWFALLQECERETACFNAALVDVETDRIQPFDTARPFTVVIRQLYFPETRVTCTMNREAREVVVTWSRKDSHSAAPVEQQAVLEISLSNVTGDLQLARNGQIVTTNQVAELILLPLMNRHHHGASLHPLDVAV